jgi:hypothetical protein
MKINQIKLLFAVAFAVLLNQSAGATTYLVDQFLDYATGQLGATATGNALGWTSPQPEVTVTNGSGSLEGTSLGLEASLGDKVSIFGTNVTSNAPFPNGCYNLFIPTANKGALNAQNTTNIYASFLYRFNVGTDISNCMFAAIYYESGGVASSSGDYGFLQLFARQAGGGQIQIGVAKNVFNTNGIGGGGVTNWDGTTVTAGQTFFVVVRSQLNVTNASNIGGFTTTSFETNVIDDLWIDPAPASFGVAESSVPTPDVSSLAGDGTVPGGTGGPGRFFIMEDGANANLDEIRIASSWAEVTPPVGTCDGAQIINSPTNVTQSAEINAILKCDFNGTGATNQWQISQNNGTNWTSIPGANFAEYVTPNLQLATDNGNQYRCIVGVGCDNTVVTSAVATVTLTAPVVTPDGLIMGDFFVNQLFNDPVTTNNSVWYGSEDASSDELFTDYPGPGATATTITNTSTLYVGYFVNTNTPPVDLAIGNEIQVTFPFTPNDFSQFTGNGPVEFGLFDYYDGGTPINSTTTVTGSTGNGVNVRGYMLSVDFGPTFTSDTPLSLYTRDVYTDIGLMNTTGDYISMQSGPTNGTYTGATAFQSGTPYTLVFSVTRTALNACSVTATITGGGTNWSYTAVDTNSLGYHRFDSFAMRCNSGVESCNNFFIPEFNIVVLPVTLSPTSISITNVSASGGNVIIGWSPTPAGSYTYSVLSTTNLAGNTWVTNQTGISANSYTNTAVTANASFYRVRSP